MQAELAILKMSMQAANLLYVLSLAFGYRDCHIMTDRYGRYIDKYMSCV